MTARSCLKPPRVVWVGSNHRAQPAGQSAQRTQVRSFARLTEPPDFQSGSIAGLNSELQVLTDDPICRNLNCRRHFRSF
ncbi:MAG: hypothetical protein A2W31_08085 [Planctomycetes bacterium RBG_16_64_10]|nr:MAG: hypothetical protein A2W31_08085 [Planctomycetes bacterium RBG_16_64_10]